MPYNSTYVLCFLGHTYLINFKFNFTFNFNFNFNLCAYCRSFPADVYKPLLTCFTNVMKSTRSVASATKSFRYCSHIVCMCVSMCVRKCVRALPHVYVHLFVYTNTLAHTFNITTLVRTDTRTCMLVYHNHVWKV